MLLEFFTAMSFSDTFSPLDERLCDWMSHNDSGGLIDSRRWYRLSYGVMVAQQILVLFVKVRILVGQRSSTSRPI